MTFKKILFSIIFISIYTLGYSQILPGCENGCTPYQEITGAIYDAIYDRPNQRDPACNNRELQFWYGFQPGHCCMIIKNNNPNYTYRILFFHDDFANNPDKVRVVDVSPNGGTSCLNLWDFGDGYIEILVALPPDPFNPGSPGCTFRSKVYLNCL